MAGLFGMASTEMASAASGESKPFVPEPEFPDIKQDPDGTASQEEEEVENEPQEDQPKKDTEKKKEITKDPETGPDPSGSDISDTTDCEEGNRPIKSENVPQPEKKDGRERKDKPAPKLGKLEGSTDFQSWTNSMKEYLEMYGVECNSRYTYWDVVTGDLKRPSRIDTLALDLDLEDWIIADSHAYLTMRKYCEKEPYTLLRSCKTAYDAYKILTTHYGNKTISDLGTVLKNLTKFTYKEGDSVSDHINAFEAMWKTLLATACGPLKPKHERFGEGLKIIASDEAAKIEVLLATFPPSYQHTITDLRTKDDYTYGDIVADLKSRIRKSTWKRVETGTKEDPTFLKTEIQLRDRQGRPLDPSKKCDYCINIKNWKGIGHTEAECRTKSREEVQGVNGTQKRDQKQAADDIRPHSRSLVVRRPVPLTVKVPASTPCGHLDHTLICIRD